MQSAGVSQISEVIPHINNFKDDSTKHPAVHSAAVCGLAILNKYYQMSDESFIYRIVMSLNPQFKLQYFVDQEWPPAWVNTVRDITR